MFFHGKRDAEPPRSGVPLMHDLLKTLSPGVLPSIPANFGHGYDLGATGWGMLGNGPDDTVFQGFQGCGNCAWAGPGHEEEESAKDAGRPVPKFSGKTIVAQYSAYSGYDPQTGSSDNGSNVQDVLQWRQSKGLYDDDGNVYKILQYVALTPGDVHELWAATYLFECVGVGVQLQQAQQDAFPRTWDYAKGSPVVGGHYVPFMGNNGLISWGDRVQFTQAFYKNQCDEAYAWIDPLRYNAVTGKSAESYTNADLELYINNIAQAKSSGTSN